MCRKCSCNVQAFGPFVFYDTDSKESVPEGSSSLVNVTEVEMVLCVYAQLMSYHPELKSQGSVAVISSYKAQVHCSHTPLRSSKSLCHCLVLGASLNVFKAQLHAACVNHMCNPLMR